MNFFKNLLNKIKSINISHKQPKQYLFGTIMSGTYSNWKNDPHPTIFCFGCYNKNGINYVHGLQLHSQFSDINYLIGTIQNIKNNGITTNPFLFFNYIEQNNPNFIKKCYRTYNEQMCNFKIVSPGLSNIPVNQCYKSDDSRDWFLKSLNGQDNYNKIIDTNQLRNNITRVINSVKVWD